MGGGGGRGGRGGGGGFGGRGGGRGREEVNTLVKLFPCSDKYGKLHPPCSQAMTDLSLIASRLDIRAVDLDGKTADELLQLLIDAITTFDNELGNLPRTECVGRMVKFFQTHKCDLLNSEWMTSFEKGEKRVLYSLLHWTLSNSDVLSMRSYLEPFLMPLDVPEEFLSSNDDLEDMFEDYKEFQHDFVDIHKTFQSLKESKVLLISELTNAIDIAEREKKQLLQRDQRTGDSSPTFQQLLSLTSTLREAQARALGLEQQKVEQLKQAESAEACLQSEMRVLSILSNNENSIDRCITELKTESQKAVLNLETGLIPKRLQLEAVVAKDEEDAAKPSTPEDDTDYLEELLFQMDQKRLQITDEGNDSLLKQVGALSSRLSALQQIANEKSRMNNMYSRENRRLRDELEKKDSDMTYHEHPSSLQEKIKLYEVSKEEMFAAQQHNVELEGKKEGLTKRLQAVELTLQREEEKVEISGYREVSKHLDTTFQDTCVLNEIKSKILDEMSTIVKNIEEKKETLEPMIAKLKQERSVFQQIRDEHNIHKSRYEELQQKLFDENKSLEEKSSMMQKECEERESVYKLLTTTESITASTLLESKIEEVLPEEEPYSTANLSQLYQDKYDQLQQLQNELRKEQQGKKGGQDYNSKQDAMFKSLKLLLEMKQRSLVSEER
eukprot:scaffold6464_cov145-Skeletonema_menzelii.AAC.1